MATVEPSHIGSDSALIARNSFWYGLELLVATVGAFGTSVAVARAVGPTQLGYYNYISWLIGMTGVLGSLGLPMSTRKYVSEYLGRGEVSVAKAIYRSTLRLQTLMGFGIAAVACGWTSITAPREYRWAAVLLCLNIAPRMIGFIASQVNVAAQCMKANTKPATVGAVTMVVLTLASLKAGYGLSGVAASFLTGTFLETMLKLANARKVMGTAAIGTISPALRKRMYKFTGQGLGLMLLQMVVWDKSDILVLKMLNSDIRQVAFFSLAFNIVERLLTAPNAIGNALGANIMVQSGRDALNSLNAATKGTKYLLLISCPLMLGMAAVTRPTVLLLYGSQYQPLVPVLFIAAVLALPKALMAPAYMLLEATEHQPALIGIVCVTGALDIGLDIVLTPRQGAVGAALANGIAQTAAAAAVWFAVSRLFRVRPRVPGFGRIIFSSLVMMGIAFLVEHVAPGFPGLCFAVILGALAWFGTIRMTGALNEEDARRLHNIISTLPSSLSRSADQALRLLIRPARAPGHQLL